ncbi:hypothetical protein GHYDROH2_10730 [Geobacter hydrogenophilus]|uniref:His-Xaa-Ser system protein HxsD n=3 Tax=Geobacter hydrogenophilus TaxID=40983 RepID=A0A9W6LAW9_9BACT|nr:hypothetical protein GHYDROH2_10730 [Geobacter hydrogenophilus]
MQLHMSISNGGATASLNKEIYDKEAVMAAAYRRTAKYAVEIREEGQNFVVVFTAKDGRDGNESEVADDVQSFFNDVLDEQLRQQLEQKTGRIRDLIVQHAFSPIDLRKEVRK